MMESEQVEAIAKPYLMCPVCREALLLQEKTWQCVQKHSFDVAKQGYVNLHIVQHKHSKTPGDTPESVTARRAFLSEGYYAPLKQAITACIKKYGVKYLLDIGCGEGYYTSSMQASTDICVGVDISKSAVQSAAKTNRSVTWIVGTGAVLPVLDTSMDMCTTLFSPIPTDEILRVLKPEGYCLVAVAASKHLYAMREALFGEVNLHDPDKIEKQLEDHFELIEKECIHAPLNLNQQALKNLIAMTPYAYKAKQERREQLELHTSFDVVASFQLYLFKKKAA